MRVPHKLNNVHMSRECVFYLGKNAFSSLAFSGMCKQFVWQQAELCVFRAWLRLRLRTFLLS